MKFLYDRDISTLDYYKRKMAMDYKMVDGILYVKTEVSCWKLVYSRREEKIFLYHRNKSSQPLNFDLPQAERYHRQTDVQPSASINKHLRYIYEHDRYRAAEAKGEKLVTTEDRKQVNLYNFGWIKWNMREGTIQCLLRKVGNIWAYTTQPLQQSGVAIFNPFKAHGVRMRDFKILTVFFIIVVFIRSVIFVRSSSVLRGGHPC